MVATQESNQTFSAVLIISMIILFSLFDFYDKSGDGIVDDACFDLFIAFSFEGVLVAVELVTVPPGIMFAGRIENQSIVARTCLVVYDNVFLLRFPDEVDIAAYDVAIIIKMTERPLVMAFDGFAIA